MTRMHKITIMRGIHANEEGLVEMVDFAFHAPVRNLVSVSEKDNMKQKYERCRRFMAPQ